MADASDSLNSNIITPPQIGVLALLSKQKDIGQHAKTVYHLLPGRDPSHLAFLQQRGCFHLRFRSSFTLDHGWCTLQVDRLGLIICTPLVQTICINLGKVVKLCSLARQMVGKNEVVMLRLASTPLLHVE